MSEPQPYVPAETSLADWSWRGLVVGTIFGAVLGSANAYLGLKVGLTISTSIPLAVIMVAVFAALRPVLGKASILDVNIGQTAGSASSSLASGTIFTIPALFMWGLAPALGQGFVQVALLACCGGVLGILFMIPLRQYLIVQEHPNLPYPEGTASAAVLVAADAGGARARPVFVGLGLGAVYKAVLSLAKLWPDEVDIHVPVLKKGVIGIEPTPALLGVGYVLGYRISAIMVAGGLLSWLGIIPLMALFGESLPGPLFPHLFPAGSAPKLISAMSADEIWSRYVRYVGAGAVATAGIIAVVKAMPVMIASVREGVRGLAARGQTALAARPIRTRRDLPIGLVLGGTLIVVVALAVVPHILGGAAPLAFRAVAAVCVAVFAFLFVTVSSRIVGLVGVTSNPTSGMAIVTLIGTSVLFYALGWTDDFGKITVLTIGTVVCVAASIAGDISQDLKTGYLIGATPARQQTAELAGVLVNTWVIAGVVLLLGSQYGFGGVDFPAPQATLMKTVIDGVLNANLPWGLVLTGASFSIVAELLGIPSLAFAVGIYLPLSTMTPVFCGGCLRALVERADARREAAAPGAAGTEQGVLFASGLIAGEGVMGIGIAVAALAMGRRPPGLGFAFTGVAGEIVSLAALAALGWWLYRTAVRREA